MNKHYTADFGGRETFMREGCYSGDAKLVAEGIQSGYDVNKGNDHGDTPLHWAAESGHGNVVRVLMEAGADVNKPNKSGWTPLDSAFMQQHMFNGEFGAISALIEGGAVVAKSDTIPLHWAAQNGQSAITAFLINAGHPVNQADGGGMTALHWAAGRYHAEVITALVESGADVNAGDANSRTPLDFALENYQHDDGIMQVRVISNIIKKGAKVKWDDINNRQLLHLAAAEKETDVVFTLVKAGADVHFRNHNNETAADVAEQKRGRKDTIAIFLREVENRQAHNERQEAEDMLRQLD